MNIQFLEYFVQVAETGSFSKAAEKACLTQSALSRAIGTLEKELGCSLFRRGSKLSLTQEGEVLWQHCQRLFPYLDEICDDIRVVAGKSSKVVRLAFPDVLSQAVIPQIVADFSSRKPDYELRMLKLDNIGVENKLNEEIVDFGFVTRSGKSENHDSIRILSDYFVLIAPDKHKTTGINSLVKEYPLFLRSSCQLEEIKTQTDLFKRFPKIQSRTSINCYYTLKRMVELEMGLAIIPRCLCDESIAIIEMYPGLEFNVYCIYKKNFRANSAGKAFQRIIFKLNDQ